MEKYAAMCHQDCKIENSLKPQICTICMTQRLMNGKWKWLIIYLLRDKKMRFSEIKRAIPKVTQAYLSSQLKELVEDGILVRYSYNVVPPKVEYYLSEDGKAFMDVIDDMGQWGTQYLKKHYVDDEKTLKSL